MKKLVVGLCFSPLIGVVLLLGMLSYVLAMAYELGEFVLGGKAE